MVAGGSLTAGHELGTTRVAAQLQESGDYVIDVTTDAATLLERVDRSAARTPPAERLGSLLEARVPALLAQIHVAFDGQTVVPAVQVDVSPSAEGAPPVATIRLLGVIPRGATAFTWKYGWTFSSYPMTVRIAGAEASTQWLQAGEQSAPVLVEGVAPRSRAETARRYFGLGFTHILPYGLDHVLFVLGLYLLCGKTRAVLWQTTAFTVAHSLTLALGIYGVVSVPARIVEPLIAMSIAYVAIENILLAELRARRVALVFAFGLLHGLGFAGVLRDLGLPRSEFVAALLTFNLGVEAGQLAVIAAAVGLVGWRAHAPWYRPRVVVPASMAIAGIAVYWTLERLVL